METTPDRPLCFVLMPFGIKKEPTGGPDIDFDAIYEQGLRPGIEDAGLESVRADGERTGGIIHRAMFERLLLCEFAVADLTTANANVFYELGVRHAARPSTTLAVFASHQRLPFDLNYLRCLPYNLSDGNRFGESEAKALRSAIGARLMDLRSVARKDGVADSPLFQVLTGYQAPDLARLRTDTFRDQVRYSSTLKERLAAARAGRTRSPVEAIERELGTLDAVETGVLIDLLLSYRAVSAHDAMIALYDRLPATVQRTLLVQEQLGFALNRLKRREEALRVLQGVLDEHGPSSETLGLMGRIQKDLWTDAVRAGNGFKARGHLDNAIAHYVRGFEADWRDAYPGINAATLLDIKGDQASLKKRDDLLPVVRFAVSQRLRWAKPDYWDHATRVELGVLGSDREAASQALADALAAQREPWEATTTANNLRLIRDARESRGAGDAWVTELIEALEAAGTPAR